MIFPSLFLHGLENVVKTIGARRCQMEILLAASRTKLVVYSVTWDRLGARSVLQLVLGNLVMGKRWTT
ncbi:hypothetical protein H6F63_13255 [Trichocoleus sp. FACHB-40]|nr:hypothetical protein [Trichocoleus sp. FACHB-40]